MAKKLGKFENVPGECAVPESVRVLAVCLAGTNELGVQLEGALQSLGHVQLVRESLPDEALTRQPSALPGLLARVQPGLLLLCLPGESDRRKGVARAVLEAVQESRPALSVIVLLEATEPNSLRQLINMGAADFCLAPLRTEDLLPRILRWSVSRLETNTLLRELEMDMCARQFLGMSLPFLEAINKIPKLARCNANILITGETGTGKEMCARAIHQLGPRAGHPFVPVNCGAIPVELLENELFGHAAGAFTGAAATTCGLVHDAEGGTLFLDEIDSLPLPAQVKFLRFLQDQEYRPLGARKACQADIRIIAACNAELETLVHAGRLRADLYYRLNILSLKLPPLRERREDIPLLARHFAMKYAGESGLPAKELSGPALEKLLVYRWPGNVRELENIMVRALVLSEAAQITGDDVCLPGEAVPAEEISFKALKSQAIKEFESAYIRRLLVLHDGNISRAARAAKKNRRAFWQLMRKHAIRPAAMVAGR